MNQKLRACCLDDKRFVWCFKEMIVHCFDGLADRVLPIGEPNIGPDLQHLLQRSVLFQQV